MNNGSASRLAEVRKGCKALRTKQCADALVNSVSAHAIMEYAPDGVLLVNHDGRIEHANGAVAALSGYAVTDLIGKNLGVLLPSEIMSRHAELVNQFFSSPRRRVMGSIQDSDRAEILEQKHNDCSLLDFHLVHKLGHRIRVDVSIGPCEVRGDTYVIAFVRDVTHLTNMELSLAHQADHDGLTGLPNRRLLNQELLRTIAKANRFNRRFGLLLMDLNGFKEVNDRYGHAVGDRVLQEMSKRLTNCIRESDLLVRLGGDEFVVLIPEIIASTDCHELAKKVLTSLCRPLALDELTFNLTASIGFSCFPEDGKDAETLMRYADMAMYRGKRGQGNAIVAYNMQMANEVQERTQIQERLRGALTKGTLELHYQPQVDPRTGRLYGVEALLRWTDPVVGNVSPDRVIKAIESTELIHHLGRWVLETAFAQVAAWNKKGWPTRVSVNLSARQFLDENLEGDLMALLMRHEVSATQLEIEITETHVMENIANTASILARLRSAGFSLALDDFGEGYSNFAQLQRLPVRHLKFSRDFIGETTVKPHGQRLMRALVSMAKALEFSVVAEGIETQAQADMIVEFGCDLVQGWYYDKALCAEDLQKKWLCNSGRSRETTLMQP